MYTSHKISDVLAGFQDYMRAERNFSPKTIHGYKEALRLFIKISGDLNLETIRLQHFACKSFQIRFPPLLQRSRGGILKQPVTLRAEHCTPVCADCCKQRELRRR